MNKEKRLKIGDLLSYKGETLFFEVINIFEYQNENFAVVQASQKNKENTAKTKHVITEKYLLENLKVMEK